MRAGGNGFRGRLNVTLIFDLDDGTEVALAREAIRGVVREPGGRSQLIWDDGSGRVMAGTVLESFDRVCRRLADSAGEG
jgi:hypothetical protein